MNPTEYTGSLINSGLLGRIYTDRLQNLSEAKERFKETIYPAEIAVRGKEFVLIRTSASIEYHDRTYKEVMLVLDTENVTVEWRGRRYGMGSFVKISDINEPDNLIKILVKATAHNPRKIVRTLRRLDTVIQWYNNRRAGLERAARQTLRQQSKWVQQLSNEITMRSLSDDQPGQ